MVFLMENTTYQVSDGAKKSFEISASELLPVLFASTVPHQHRRLQSCVGTRARLGYGKLFRHYTVRYTYVLCYRGGMPRVFASGPTNKSTNASK